jgi:hypothetical protein
MSGFGNDEPFSWPRYTDIDNDGRSVIAPNQSSALGSCLSGTYLLAVAIHTQALK